MQLVGDDQLHLSGCDQLTETGDALRCGAKLVTAVDHRDVRDNFRQRQCPINGRITSACDHHAAVAKILSPGDKVVNAPSRPLPFEAFDSLQRRPIRAERADPGCDNDRLGRDRRSAVGLYPPAAILFSRNRCNLPAQMENGLERSGLFQESLDKLGGKDARMPGNVEDRLFRIERAALPARLVEGIENMTAHAQHATFEDREQADRPGADDRNVGWHGIGGHERSLSMAVSVMVAPGGSRPQEPEWAGRETGSSTVRVLGDRVLAMEQETAAYAAGLATLVQAGDVIALRGDLGAGKTTLARALIRAYGSPDEEVPSPTFTLVQIYEPCRAGAVPLWHFDLFRVALPEDALELGIEDAFTSGITLIEWPERLGPLLPAHRLELVLTPGPSPESRRLSISGTAAWGARLRQAGLA